VGATATIARRPLDGVRGLARAVESRRLTLSAFVVSRLLVLAAGAFGAVQLSSHRGGAAVHQAVASEGPLGYLLKAGVDQWDAGFYLAIARHGYGSTATDRAAFYPLYPWSMRILGWAIGSPLAAGVAISLMALLAALLMLHRLTELELGREAADTTILLVAFAPLSFFFSAVYTESLFLALTVGALLALRTDRWRIACALAALACLTRVTGVALLPALAFYRVRERPVVGRRALGDPELLWLALAPLALGIFALALRADGQPVSAMLTSEHVWHHETVGPVIGLGLGVLAAITGAAQLLRGAAIYRFSDNQALAPPAENLVVMVVVAIALRALVTCWRRLPIHYAIYALLAMAIVLSSPVSGAPLTSVDRYVLTIFPLWMAAGSWIARRRLTPWVIAASCALLVFYSAQFAAAAFVA
jgi:hypothetical protein